MLASILAGCVSGDEDLEAATGTVSGALKALGCPTDTEGLSIVHFSVTENIQLPESESDEAAGVQIIRFPGDAVFDSGDTICWINDGMEDVDVLAMPLAVPDQPEWTNSAAPPPDPHAGHDMSGGGGDGHEHTHAGGMTGVPVFEFPLIMGETKVSIIEYDGDLMVHTSQAPVNMGTWTVTPNETASYPLTISKVQTLADRSGETAAGASTDETFSIAFPDLVKVKATLEWKDSLDDLDAGGPNTNQGETFKVEIIDPSGNVLKESTKTARDDSIILDLDVQNAAWPDVATGMGERDAAQNLYTERPPDATYVGDWIIRVTLVSSGGLVPDGDGTLNPASTDGSQSWTLLVDFFHEFASVKGPGDGGTPVLLKTNL